MKKFILISWGYIVEIILAILVVVLIRVTVEKYINIAYILGKIDLLIGGIIAVLSAKIAIFIYYLTLVASDFGDYLMFKRANSLYKNAFLYSMLIDLLSITSVITWNTLNNINIFRVTLFFIILTILTLFTMLQNLFEIVNLYNKFNKIQKYQAP